MPRALCVLVALMFTGCPTPAKIERGTLLRWKKSSDDAVRDVVEKRLALARLKARVAEDNQRLDVRVPDGGDVVAVKTLLSLPGRFELCEALPADAGAGRALDGVTVPTTCLSPRLLTGELRDHGFAQVTWSAASAKEVGELTQRLMGQQLVFVVDGKAALTAVVETPITGTRALVPIDGLARLQAVLGGELDSLTFEVEQRYP